MDYVKEMFYVLKSSLLLGGATGGTGTMTEYSRALDSLARGRVLNLMITRPVSERARGDNVVVCYETCQFF